MKLRKKDLLMRFLPAAEVQDNRWWHIAVSPIEGDRTLCGIAHEGFGKSTVGKETNTTKTGNKITCEDCIALIRLCRKL